jgi:Transglutaminase-like superfamily
MRRYSAPPSTAPRIYLGRIPKGYAGTLRTAEHVKRLIREGTKDFYVRQRAIDILLARGVRPKNYLGEIEALFEWVQRHVRYTKDPFRVEVLHSPRRMLELRAGDCDDMTILLGSMLESIGHPVRLVLTGPDPLRPRLFSHVYLEVNHQGGWIPCDATMPHPLGWAPRALVKQVIPIEEEPKHGIRGDGVARHSGPAGGAGLALGTDSGDSPRRRAGQRSSGQDAVGPAPGSAAPGAEPVAQAAAAPHLGQGIDAARASEDQPPDQGAASGVGHPAAGRNPESDRDPESARHRAPHRAPAFRAAVAADPAGVGAPDRPSAAGRAGGGTALNGYVRHGAGLYRRFNRFDPSCVVRVTHCRVIPPVVVQLGELVGLIYRSDKWQRGEPRTYIHFMQTPPRLVSDPGGRQLFLVGGRYRVTAQGIEG